MHVVGETIVDTLRQRVAAVFSTLNLLLNGFRACTVGRPLQILHDATYRLVTEGHATFLVGVMAPNQVFHIVAYALVSNEDQEALCHCFRQIKAGVEAAVEMYREKGLPV